VCMCEHDLACSCSRLDMLTALLTLLPMHHLHGKANDSASQGGFAHRELPGAEVAPVELLGQAILLDGGLPRGLLVAHVVLERHLQQGRGAEEQ